MDAFAWSIRLEGDNPLDPEPHFLRGLRIHIASIETRNAFGICFGLFRPPIPDFNIHKQNLTDPIVAALKLVGLKIVKRKISPQ